VALQLYTLREFCKTPANIAATMRRVRQIGYAAVQASGLGPIEPVELRRIFDGEGLVCCATHRSLEQLESDPNRVIDEHATLGCRYTAIGGFFLPSFTAGDWAEFITRYNAIAKRYAGSALAIGYHNHHHEFARFDGMPAMQRLIDELDRSVWIELDTYWVQHGGGDPAAWIGKVRGRLPCVHLKDMTVTADKKQVMAEVGEGNLNWPAILEACRAAGVEWYIVEQDTCQRDPFESIAISLHNVHAMGLR
jgi:sugar phosphate isomerase/epimerase